MLGAGTTGDRLDWVTGEQAPTIMCSIIRKAGDVSLRFADRRSTTPKPAVVRGLEHEHVVQVAAGGWHCLAVTKSGSIYAWGGNEYFQCGVDAGM